MIRILLLTLLLSSPLLAAEPSSIRQAEIRNLLKHDCGSCHGLTLKGGLGPALLAKRLHAFPDDFLIETIQKGRKGTAMPPWQPFLSIEETEWLVRTLLKQQP